MENKALGKVPVGDIAHFNERRGFERLYANNQAAQARAVMFLVGFMAMHEEFGNAHERSAEVASALRVVLRDFVTTFPDFMSPSPVERGFGGGNYTPDERLLRSVNDSLEGLG